MGHRNALGTPYLTILRTRRPPITSKAPPAKANSEAAPLPPVFGSSFLVSSFLVSSFLVSSFLVSSFGAGVGAVLGAGAGAAFFSSDLPAADAAWLIVCSHASASSGLTPMEEPPSSNSMSSASESASITSDTFCALPLWAAAKISAHGLALPPELETSNDWPTSPLSPCCSDSCSTCATTGPEANNTIASIAASSISLLNYCLLLHEKYFSLHSVFLHQQPSSSTSNCILCPFFLMLFNISVA